MEGMQSELRGQEGGRAGLAECLEGGADVIEDTRKGALLS